MENNEKKKSGMLQKFIESPGSFNTTIEVKWSPSLLTAEKIINNLPIDQIKYDPYKRACSSLQNSSDVRIESIKNKALLVQIKNVIKTINKVS